MCVCCVPGTVLDLHASFYLILAITPRISVHIQWALGHYINCLLYFLTASKCKSQGTTSDLFDQKVMPFGYQVTTSLPNERHWKARPEDLSLVPEVPTTRATS